MAYANGFYGLRDAYKATRFPVAKYVYQSVWSANQLACFMMFAPILDGTATLDYRRRAHGDTTKLNWIVPGQAISATKDPAIVEARSTLRLASHNVPIPSHLRNNFINGQFMSPGGGPFRQGPDPLYGKVLQVVSDMARQAWDTAISGRYIDTCALAPEGSLTSTFINGAIFPGPFNDPAKGDGSLKFKFGTKKVSYKAPGDADYGPEVGPVATNDVVTLRSGNTAGYITFKVATLPGADAQAELLFSSTTNQPDGLFALMEPSQRVTLGAPTAIDFKHLDQLDARLHPAYRQRPQTCYVMHDDQLNALMSLARAMGGTTLVTKSFGELMREVPAGMEQFGLIEVPTYRGHPILIDNSIPIQIIGGKPTRSVALVCLDPRVAEAQGIDYGAFVGGVRGSHDGPVMSAFGLGWEIDFLGKDQNSANDLARVTLELCWALGSSGAAAQTEGFYDP